jgi:glyoxylase-like metal-dependent hydrolase (beta-lactamase superfamily II)
MVKDCMAAAALVAAGMLLTGVLHSDASADLKAAVDKSRKAMGAENLKTLVISGEGWDGCVGQPYNPNTPWWRKFSNKNYVRAIDFEARGWRLQRVRGEGENPPRGGCNAGPVADTTQNQVTMAGAMAPWNTQLEYIFLPEGFLRVALEKNATVSPETIKGKKYTVVSFLGDNKAPVNGYINDQGYVEKVETKIDNNVLGDITWNAIYTDWKDFNGVKFPAHIEQYQGTPKYFDLAVNDVKPNAPVDLTPPAGRGRGGPGGGGRGGRGGEAPASISEDLGGGFWLITGGYAAIVADFKDYIVVIEGPQNDMRATQIITEAKRLVPNKPIKYVINTHAHFDHSGGLRAFVAEGATIITHQVNKAYYEKIFKDPHTLVPDKLSQMSPQPKVKIETMTEKRVLTDGQHVIDLYHVQGSTHNEGMIIAYLPKEKVLLEADEFNVGAANAPTPANINPYHTNLLANIERLKLDVDRIIPVHLPGDNRKVTMAELYTAAGKKN